MAPPYRKVTPAADAPPRVGGYVTYRKRGGSKQRGLIQWINGDGSLRVKPTIGRVTIIDADDIARASE